MTTDDELLQEVNHLAGRFRRRQYLAGEVLTHNAGDQVAAREALANARASMDRIEAREDAARLEAARAAAVRAAPATQVFRQLALEDGARGLDDQVAETKERRAP